MCGGFTRRKSALCRTLGMEKNNQTFYVNFCWTMPYLSLHSDLVRVCVVLGVASLLSKLWRNDSGSTGKQNMFKQDFSVFLYIDNGG